MSISIRCTCGSEAHLTAKVCSRCNKPFPKKGRRYRVVVRDRGKKITRTTTNLEVAREIESKLKVDIARGEHQLKKKIAPTISEVWKEYVIWAETHKPKSFRTDKGYYEKHLAERFSKKRLDSISPFDVERLMSDMRKSVSKRKLPYSPTTIRHVVVLLGRLYSYARSRRMFSGASPCLDVEFPKHNNQVTEHLDADQLQRLLDTLAVWPDRMSSSFVMFLLHTGLRRGELFKLRWEDIDMERRLIILRDPKGKVDTTLPLSNKAVDVLRCIPRDYETEYVFYGKGGQQRVDFSGPWKRIRKAAGLPNNFRLHGLRHHFASALVSDGVDIYTVSKLLTHKDIKTTQRYAHLADKALRAAVNRSDELLSENGTSKIIDLHREQVND